MVGFHSLKWLLLIVTSLSSQWRDRVNGFVYTKQHTTPIQYVVSWADFTY